MAYKINPILFRLGITRSSKYAHNVDLINYSYFFYNYKMYENILFLFFFKFKFWCISFKLMFLSSFVLLIFCNYYNLRFYYNRIPYRKKKTKKKRFWELDKTQEFRKWKKNATNWFLFKRNFFNSFKLSFQKLNFKKITSNKIYNNFLFNNLFLNKENKINKKKNIQIKSKKKKILIKFIKKKITIKNLTFFNLKKNKIIHFLNIKNKKFSLNLNKKYYFIKKILKKKSYNIFKKNNFLFLKYKRNIKQKDLINFKITTDYFNTPEKWFWHYGFTVNKIKVPRFGFTYFYWPTIIKLRRHPLLAFRFTTSWIKRKVFKKQKTHSDDNLFIKYYNLKTVSTNNRLLMFYLQTFLKLKFIKKKIVLKTRNIHNTVYFKNYYLDDIIRECYLLNVNKKKIIKSIFRDFLFLQRVSYLEIDCNLFCKIVVHLFEMTIQHKELCNLLKKILKITQKKYKHLTIKIKLKGKTQHKRRTKTIYLYREEAPRNLPLNNLKSNIEYALGSAETLYGSLGIKIWFYVTIIKNESKMNKI